MRYLTLLVAALLVFSLACGGMGTAEKAEVDQQPRSVDAPAAEAPTAPGSVDAESLVDQYFEDCHFVFMVPDEWSDEPIAACSWQEFDQMCAPDPSGCWDKEESCKTGCVDPCNSCEDSCASGCDDCKSQCDGAAGCLRDCALQRESCHEACIQQRDTCQYTTCRQVGIDCYTAHDALVAQVCPSCSEFTQCVNDRYMEGNFDTKDCEVRFAKEDARCIEWCAPGG